MEQQTQSALAGTKTEQNLRDAARGEALAHTKYLLFSHIAANDGQEVLSRMFGQFADNEKEHAELWLGYLNELGSNEENLENALSGERFENTTFYPEAARVAEEEGFEELADKFRMTADVEGHHASAYGKMLDALRDGDLYEGDAETEWLCLNCGFRTKGNMPPEQCPLCSYPRGFFTKNRR